MKVYLDSKQLWSDIKPANTIWKRFIGLTRTKKLGPEQGLLIWPCRQVHGFHMQYAIDIIFLDKSLTVVGIFTLEPGRISPALRQAQYALEVNAGQARLYGVRVGQMMTIPELVKNRRALSF